MADDSAPGHSPKSWCQQVLHTLSRRRIQARKAQELELFLGYVIDLDPTPAAFADLLAEHATDSRPVHAEVAQGLELAWLRTRVGALPLPTVPLQETLRTLGAILDEYEARAGYVSVAAGHTQVQPFGEWHPRAFDPLELLHEIAARTAMRGHVRRADPGDPNRFESRLRVVGATLDAEPQQAYELLASRQTIVVEGSAGYYQVYTPQELVGSLLRFTAQRDVDE